MHIFFLHLSDNYGKKNSGGRPKGLSSGGERKVLQLASTRKYSSRKIIKQNRFQCLQKTICITNRRAGNFQYKVKLAKPPLCAAHKIQRLSFARETMT